VVKKGIGIFEIILGKMTALSCEGKGMIIINLGDEEEEVIHRVHHQAHLLQARRKRSKHVVR